MAEYWVGQLKLPSASAVSFCAQQDGTGPLRLQPGTANILVEMALVVGGQKFLWDVTMAILTGTLAYGLKEVGKALVDMAPSTQTMGHD